MTHHTDTERAEFEAAIRATMHDAGEDHIAERLERWPDGAYKDRATGYAWWGYQKAARRAPVVPQCPFPCGWKNLHKLVVAEGAFLAKSLNECEPITTHQRDVVMRVVHYGIEMARSMLAAAPQPPEAAPVQLPEHVYTLRIRGRLHDHTPALPAFDLEDGEHKLYTEHQLSAILAQHGIKTK